MEKRLGKITSVRLGDGGYQDACFGVTFGLGGDGWDVGDFRGFWSPSIKVDKYTKWTEKDRDKGFSDTMRFVADLMTQAKVCDFTKLKGIPVEVEFDGQMLKSWRILGEVL